MRIEEAISAFLAHRTIKGVTDITLRMYEFRLDDWCSWLAARSIYEVQDIELGHLRDYLLYLRAEHIPHSGNPYRPNAPKPGLAPASLEQAYKVLASFWRYLGNHRELTEEQREFFTRELIPRPRVPLRARQYYNQHDLEEILLAAAEEEEPERRYRSQAIILLLLESGMRVTELCTLEDSAVDHQRRRARIVGKGDKERWVYWHARGALALRQYVLCRTGGSGGRIFRGPRGGAVSRSMVYKLMVQLGERAGVKLPPSPVHALRHTFAHRAIHAGVPLPLLSQLMGHSDVQTTMRYVLEDPEALQKAHASIAKNSTRIPAKEKDGS
jgi:site-specific recombinase XerD